VASTGSPNQVRAGRGSLSPRVLIGGVGYSYLRDGSLGPVMAAALARERWPEHVLVEDLSYGPIAVMQHLQDFDPPLARLVLVAAVRRGGRAPGTMSVFRWDGRLPAADEVQARVAEAVTGVISLDNLLAVVGFFDALPDEVWVVEVEPGDEGWGEGFSEAVLSSCPRIGEVLRALAVSTESAPVSM
jgi:hydrogenase maturation protease